MSNEIQELIKEWKTIVRIEILLISFLWMVFLLDTLLFRGGLSRNGIHPREFSHLPGILFSPFLHGTLKHIFGNSVGIVLLGSFILLRSISKFMVVSIISILISGTGIWVIGGGHTNHIGFSGVIFGYLGYLLFTGVFDKKIGSLLITAVSAILYGGMIFGVLPTQPGVSWEAHFFGFGGGVLSAFVLSKK